jgi:pimeloyl-ACP methyl ester carboxylesterase
VFSVSLTQRLAVAGAVALGVAALAPDARAQDPTAPADGSDVTTQNVCFGVTDGTDPTPATLFGIRYTKGPVNGETPAIVLVHGIASSTDNWDFLPNWSVARSLARKGYVVYSYDRLGYAKSVYPVPNGGNLLTGPAQRSVLHQMIGEVKTGAYTTTSASDCSAGGAPTGTMANRAVVIIGHSAGGWITEGYPGQYHDVVGMVQSDISGFGSTTDPPISTTQPDYTQFFASRAACESFNFYVPGEVSAIKQIACDPANFVASPRAELTGNLNNANNIKATGPNIPILLTWGDHDGIVSFNQGTSHYNVWKSTCGCDVSMYIQPNSGHLFMAHQSLTGWLDTVETWLGNHDIVPPAIATGGVGGTVGATLSLTLGAPASFGAFTPGVANDYVTSMTANVVSTAGDGTLSVADPSATATGHLVNGAFSLPSPLQAKASSVAGTGAAYANVGGSANPTPLLAYANPTSNDAVTVGFQQHVGATDALRTGSYAKTVTFTLSTTAP